VALTIKEIENAKPKAKKYKMLDGGGLCLLVLPTGTKLWLWRYQFDEVRRSWDGVARPRRGLREP
jgi:Arm DNA-binding domain